jgi:prepilin-type N-terminal cleavage/methylation domain-containing protein
MIEMLTRLRDRARGERGMTLVELLVAMAILSIVLLVFTNTLAAMQRAVVDEDVRSRLNDDARLALQTIDRMVRSGNLLYDPDNESGNDPYSPSETGYMFRVYTQTKLKADDNPRCALWLIDDQERLLYREWPTLNPSAATDWRVVATSVVNRTEGTPAFTLDAAGRTVTITFEVNPDLEHRPTATQEFSASLTGRNTAFGYPNNVCSILPSPLV